MDIRRKLVDMENILVVFSHMVVWYLSESLPDNNNSPRITMAPRDQRVMDNGQVSFFCKASGNPAPDIYWRKNDRRLTKTSRYMILDMPHGSVLRIDPARTKKDDGIYECVADNGMDERTVVSAALEVYSEKSVPSGYPEITENPTLKSIEKDKNIILSCSATGIPEPTISWLKDFIPIDTSDLRYKILPTGSLQIKHSLESDEGKYECVAENQVGVAYSYGANLYVRVRRVPPHFSIQPGNEEVMPGGAVNLTCVAIGSPMPAVRWKIGDIDLTPEEQVPIGKNVLMLTNIKETATYTCIAKSDLGTIETYVDVIVKALPKPPSGLMVSDVTASTVKLSWNSGNVEEVSSYILQYQQKDKSPTTSYTEIKNIFDTEHEITHLSAHTIYEIKIIAVNNIGQGLPSNPVDVATAELAPADPPVNIKAKPASSDSIAIEWEEPETPNGIIRGYKVYYSLTPTELPISLWTVHLVDRILTTSIGNLKPNQTYSVSILAFTSMGDGPLSEPIQVSTQLGVPGSPSNLQGEAVSPTAIQLEWEPASIIDATLESYVLYYNDPAVHQNIRVNISPPQNSYLLTDLTPNTLYNIRVTGKSAAGEGISSATLVVRTFEYVPGEPRIVKLEPINSTAVAIQWQPPSDNQPSSVIRGYQIHYARINENNDHVMASNVVDIPDGNKQETVLTGLQPDTSYQVQLMAYTRVGEGKRTRARRVKTRGSVPSAPRNLHLTIANDEPPTVHVTWQVPKEMHGIIEAYRLTYGIQGHDMVEERRFDAERKHFTTSALERGVEYEFRVAAKNHVDFGESAFEVIQTPDGVPMGAPQNFTAIGLSPTSIKLQWDPPAKKYRNGHVVLYEIVFHKRMKQSELIAKNSTEMMTTIDGLDMNMDYIFQLRAYTSKGSGPWSNKLPFRTFGQYGLPAPTNVQMRRVSSTAIELSWDPIVAASSISGYRIHYNTLAISDMDKWQVVEIGPFTVVELAGLEPHASYVVRVRAKGADGRYGNFSDMAIANKLESEENPNTVQEFRAQPINSRAALLEWTPPKRADVFRYKVEYFGMRKTRDPSGMEDTVIDPKKEVIIPKDDYSLRLDGLLPRSLYSVNISVRFIDGTWGPPFSMKMETGLDANLKVDPPNVIQMAFNQTLAEIELTPVEILMESVSDYYVIIVSSDLARNTKPENIKSDYLLTDDWSSEVQRSVWIAGRFDSASLPSQMIIGDNSRPGTGEYINRELRTETKEQNFYAFLRVNTSNNRLVSSGYSSALVLVELDSSSSMVLLPVGENKTEGSSLSAIAPVCATFLVVLIFVLIFLVARKRRYTIKWVLPEPLKLILPSNEVTSYYPIDPVEMRRMHLQTPAMMSHPPISVSELSEYIDVHSANDGILFAQEYESIEPGQQYMCENSGLEVNKPKNRYANVVAFDHSRVILHSIDGTTAAGIDYINANFIDGFRRQNAYIATQGPLPQTFDDFWKMVWEQHSTTIVMMTRLEENKQPKCDQYWPTQGTMNYGPIQVTMLDSIELASYTIRTFQIGREYSNMDEREIRHFQFTAWPDHGVPDHPIPLLLFMRRVKFLTPPDSGPVIVHCSAGVGRTGAFIVIDSMLERLKHLRTIDIYGHVTCLRCQRNYMVQTEDQYVFIYLALLEAIKSGNIEIPARNFNQHFIRLLQSAPASSSNELQMEFKRLTATQVNPNVYATANLQRNKHKNRSIDILPYESTRVILHPVQGADGSDFINANYIDSYRVKKAYIATQGPMAETTEDFWKMLWNTNSTIVVMLTKLKESGQDMCHQYWPTEKPIKFQTLIVEPGGECNDTDYIIREFKLTHTKDGQSIIVRQFQWNTWPEKGVPSKGDTFMSFIGQVQKSKEKFSKEGPITVHCSTGVGRTGVFITLSIILERLHYEGVIDMFQTVNILRNQRAWMVQTEEQYAFCYNTASEYIENNYDFLNH